MLKHAEMLNMTWLCLVCSWLNQLYAHCVYKVFESPLVAISLSQKVASFTTYDMKKNNLYKKFSFYSSNNIYT